MADTYAVTERLYRTVDDRVVKEGDPAAAFLYATPGATVPLAEAVKYGLVKQIEVPTNKAKAAPANKSK